MITYSESVFDTHICTLISSCGDQIEFVYRSKEPGSYTTYSHNMYGDKLGWGLGRPVEEPTQKFERVCELQMLSLKEQEKEVMRKIKEWQDHLESIREFMEMIPDIMLNGPKEIMRFKSEKESGDEKGDE